MDPSERHHDDRDIQNPSKNEADSARMNESETDAKLISKMLGNKKKEGGLVPDGPAIDDEEYRMDYTRRGKAIIFNHWKYEEKNIRPRAGSQVDQSKLSEAFKKLGFEIDICENYPYQRVKEKLNTVAKEDHSDADCLVVLVMTHGRSGELHAYDVIYKEKRLWEAFAGDKCPSLLGKPKLFFIQACRGDQTDEGSKLRPLLKNTQTDAKPPNVTYTIPNTADLLIAHATYDGYYAWRNADEGSWFIQALCQELNRNGTKHDILRIMTAVNRKVAITFQSYTPANKDMDKKKQMSTVLSTLTRLLYFRPKAGQ